MAVTTARRSTKTGIAFDILEGGKFYQGVMPGGFTDAQTGIHVPGPKANLDGSTKRVVVSLTELPDPIQLPHFKIVNELSEGGKTRKEVEVDFTADDEQPVHEAFQLALATGIIRMVPDETVEEKYPAAWAARSEHLVYRIDNLASKKPMLELLHDAEDAGRLANLAKKAHDHETPDLDEPRAKTLPPPPKK